MGNAGKYRWRFKRQIPLSSGTGFRDSGEFYWGMLQDMKSSEASDLGTILFETNVVIRIRNYVTLNAQDRLIDTETEDSYEVTGLQRNFHENETVVLAKRQEWGATV